MADYTARSSVILNGQQAEDQLEKLGKRAKSLREEMKKLRQANDLAGFREKEKELKEVNKEMRQMRKETFSVEAVLKNLSGASLKEISTAARKASSELKAMKQTDPGYASKANQVKLLNGKMRELSALTRTQQGFWGRMADGFNKYQTMAAAWLASIAAIVMGMKRMKDTLDDFEETITNVYTLLDEPDYEKFKNLLDEGSVELLRQYGFEIKDINKALFDTISAGVPAGESILFMKEASVLAKGGVTSLSTSVDGMTSVVNAYGLKMEEANRVSSAFFTAQKYGKTTVDQLASTVGSAVPIAAQAGVTYQELLSSVAALTTRGISTDMAMTAVKNALQSLLKPGKEAEEILRKFGVPVGATEVRAKGLGYTLEKLNKVMLENPDAVSKAIPNIRGLTAVSALSGRGLEKYHEILNKVNNDFGEGSSLMNAYTKQMDTNVAKQQARMGEVKATILELGDSLRPVFVEVIRAGNWSFRTLLKTVKVLIDHKGLIYTLVTAITAYTVALRLSSVNLAQNILLTKVKTLWTKASTAANYLAAAGQALFTGNIVRANIAMQLFNKTVKLNPVVILISILAAAGMALFQYSKRLNEVSAAQKAINDVEITARQNIVEQKIRMEQLLRTAQNETLTLESRRKALDELNKLSPEYFGNLTLEKIHSEEAKKATDGYIESLLTKARIQAAEESLMELEKERISALQSGADAQVKWYRSALNYALALGNAQQYATRQGITASQNMAKAQDDYAKKKEALIGLIGKETEANEKQVQVSPYSQEEGTNFEPSGFDAIKEALQSAFSSEQNLLKEQFLQKKLTQGQYNQEMYILELAHLVAMRELYKKHGEDFIQIEGQIIDKKLAWQQQLDKMLETSASITEKLLEEERNLFAGLDSDMDKHLEEYRKNLDKETEATIDAEDKKREARERAKEAEIESAVQAGAAAIENAETVADAGKAILNSIRQQIRGYLAEAVATAALKALKTVPFPFNIAAATVAGGAAAFLFNKIIPEFAGGKYPDIQFAGRVQTGSYGNKPQLGIFNEVPGQPETVIDGITTRNINLNYPEIMRAIYAVRDGRVPQFAQGKYPSMPELKSPEAGRAATPGEEAGFIQQLSGIIEANTKAMREIKNLRPVVAVETIEREREKYLQVKQTSGL